MIKCPGWLREKCPCGAACEAGAEFSEDSECRRMMMRTVAADPIEEQAARIREENRWIPVEERLPDEFVSVLICVPSENPLLTVKEAYLANGAWATKMAIFFTEEVTHWMPMPKGPEAQGKPRKQTRYERFRSMSLEELARLVRSSDADAERYCKGKPECQEALDRNNWEGISEEMCLECVKEWLMEEV